MPPVILPNLRIDQLPIAASIPPGSKLAMRNPVTGRTEQVDVSNFISSPTTNNFEWQSDTAYLTGDVVTYGGNWYQALDDSTNVIPGTDPATWDLIPKSPSGLVLWQAGIFAEDEVYVLRLIDGYYQLFRLATATRPYNSSNFETEFAAGDWELMSERGYGILTKTAHGWPVNTVLTFKSGNWNTFTSGDRPLAVVRAVISANIVIVVFLGTRLKGLSGLTAGQTYYAQSDGSISTTLSDNPVFLAVATTEAILFAGGSSAGAFWALVGTSILTGNATINTDGNSLYIGEVLDGGAISVFGPQASILAIDSGTPTAGVSANQDGTIEIILGSHINLNGDTGSAGQVLTTQGSGAAPTWEDVQMHFRGYYASLAALQSAIPSGNDGDYAFVDAGIGTDASIYIWDTDDDDWVSGGVTTLPDANESTKGVTEEATQSETNAGTATGGTGAKLFVTPAKLLALAGTFANQLTFTTSPIVSALTASKHLRSGSSKEIVSVDSATQAQAITGTDDVNPLTSLSLESKRSIKLKSFSNSATGSSTIDCLGAQEVTVFYNTTVTGAITIALSNDSNLEILNVIIPITGANIAITTPSTTRMPTYLEVSAGDGWYQSTKILQVSSINTADTHELSFKRASAGPTFNLLYDGPYRA